MASSRWVLLARGNGTRLQEWTREICRVPISKQYSRHLVERRSLLEPSRERVRQVTADA
jgi:hypothetical protein